MQLTQGVRRNQSLIPSRTATIFADRTISWGEIGERVARLANGLRQLGVGAGDRVAIFALNSDRYIEAYYAIAWAGAVCVPFNTRWAKAETEYAIEDSAPALALVDDHFVQQAEAFAAGGVRVVQMDASSGPHSLEGLIESAEPMEDQCQGGDSLAGIFYTGGTTARSKGVMLSHTNLIVNFFLLQAVVPYPLDTVFLHTPPMFHMADACCLFGLTNIGATHVILPAFDPNAALDTIEEHRISALVLVPTMIGMLCETLRSKPKDMSSVRRLTYGASPISSAVLKCAMTVFPNAEFLQLYGQTELSPVATYLNHADHLAGRLSSAGRAIPGVDLYAAGDDLAPKPAGEVGEIVARGPNVMQGYWRQPQLTRQAIVNGWLRTGDAGYLDEDGYVYLVDRVKDMIVSGGENIYSVEVENALMQHADILQCAVIGIPDEQWGERVHAVLHVRENSSVTEEALCEHCEPLIANYKRPKSYELRETSLPLSAAGKILKTKLRAPYWGGRTRRIN